MIKKLLTLLLAFSLFLSFVVAYTPDSYDNVQSTLQEDYMPDSYDNVISVFGEDEITPDTCSCPETNANWGINLTDNCNIQNNCDLGTGNITFTGTGNVTFNATITACDIGTLPAGQTGYLGYQARVNMGGSCP